MRHRFPWLMALAYALLLTALGIVRFYAHRNFVDFGIFEQTAASAFGCFCNTIEGSHWAFHFSPILYVAGALVALWQSPLALIVLQAVAGALAIPPIYALVERRGDARLAQLAGVIVAIYPALGALTFGDFHENGFAPAAIAWMLWAFDAGRLRVAIAAAFVAIAVKEDQAIFVGLAALLGAWRFRGTMPGRAALLVAVAAFAVAWIFFHSVQPHAAVNPHWAPVRFYAWSPGDFQTLIPDGLLARLGFILLAFAPLAFVPFRSRMMWLALVPLAEVLLSRMSTTYTLGTHYAGAWIGYVLVAFAFGLGSLPAQRARSVAYVCIALCAIEYLVANPLHPGLNLRVPTVADRALDRMIAAIPADAGVATQEEAFAMLALRDPHATLLPEDPSQSIDAPYVLIDRDFPTSPRLQEYGIAFDALVQRGAYVLVERDRGAELYRSASIAGATNAGH